MAKRFECSKRYARKKLFFIVCDDLNDFTGHMGGHPQAKT
jgi:hypothetical protein